MKTVRIKALTLTGPKTYSVVNTTCNWTVGGVPGATLVIATGRIFRTGKNEEFKLSKSDRNAVWTLNLQTSDKSYKLMSGFIVSVNRTAISSPSGSRTNVQVSLVSSEFMLSTMRVGNYYYWNNDVDGGAPDLKKATNTLPLSDANFSELSLVAGDPEQIKANLPQFILNLIGVMYGNVTRRTDEAGLKEATAEIAKYFDVSNGAGLRDDIDFFTNHELTVLPTTIEDWMRTALNSSNVMQALQTVAENLMFTIVPVNGKMQMRPLLPWRKKEDYNLNGNNCMEMTAQTELAGLLNRTQAVMVSHSGGTNANTFAEAGNGAQIGSVYPDMADMQSLGPIMTINMPAWIHSMAAFNYTGTKSATPGTRLDYDTDKIKSLDKCLSGLPEIGYKVAQTYYATHANADTKLAVRVPINLLSFKDKLGYIIRISNIEVVPETGKQTLYGMLGSVTMEARIAPDSGSMRVSWGLTNVRSSELNSDYGLDEHPIFTEKTVSGTDTSGLGGGIGSLGGLGSI